MKGTLPAAFLLLGIVTGLIGCSSKSKEAEAVSLYVGVAATYTSEDKVAGLAAYLNSGLPAYSDATNRISVTGISTGDSEADPMTVMAGSTRLATMLVSGEIELWICDAANAKRYAENGASYISLDTLFTEAELNSFAGTLIGIPITDSEGNPTGETSAICGIDLSRNAVVTEMTGIKGPQMFIMDSSSNVDAAKATFAYLAK
jgi:hypothetical protein